MESDTSYELEDILTAAMDIGECMLKCGAEIWRVEDTISRICAAYGCDKSHVFSITSMITVTESIGLKSATQTRRIYRYSYNLKQLEFLNALSREVCATTPPPEVIQKKLKEIMVNCSLNRIKKLIGYSLGTFAFTLFFGGTVFDGLIAALISIVVFSIDFITKSGKMNLLAHTVLSSCIAGFIVVGMVRAFPSLHIDKIIIGNVMLLIPGVSLCNGIRDLLCGDIVSGLLRLCEALLVAGSIAVGFAIPLLITGGV